MDLISSPALLDEMVELPQDWDFKSWSKRSFGVFHGDVATPVSLLFDAEIASRVKKVKLHHSQQISDQKDCPSSYIMGHYSGLSIGGSGSFV